MLNLSAFNKKKNTSKLNLSAFSIKQISDTTPTETPIKTSKETGIPSTILKPSGTGIQLSTPVSQIKSVTTPTTIPNTNKDSLWSKVKETASQTWKAFTTSGLLNVVSQIETTLGRGIDALLKQEGPIFQLTLNKNTGQYEKKEIPIKEALPLQLKAIQTSNELKQKGLTDQDLSEIYSQVEIPVNNKLKFSQKLQDPNWWANGIGLNAPSFLTSLGLGLATTIISGGNVALGAVAGFSSSYSMESAGVYNDAIKAGQDEKTANKLANVVGIVNGILDTALPFKLFSNLPGGKQVKKLIVKNAMKEILQNVVTESVTESLQEIVSNAAKKTYNENQDLFTGVAESAFFGGLMGGFADVITNTPTTLYYKAKSGYESMTPEQRQAGFIKVPGTPGQDATIKETQTINNQSTKVDLIEKLPKLPKVTKSAINKTIQPSAPKITIAEDVLLRSKLKSEAKGARVGYSVAQQETKTSITNQLKNTFETKISDIKRGTELYKLKTNIITRDWIRVKNEIVNYIKESIPTTDRGVFLNMVKDAKTQKDLTKAFIRIDKKAEEVIVKKAITTLKETVDGISDSNVISADYKTKIKEIVDDYELTGHSQKLIDKLKATQEFIDRQDSIGEGVELPRRILNKLKILGRTPKNELTLNQIRTIQNEIELLIKLGKTKLAAKQNLYETEKELRKNQLLDSTTSINSTKIKNIGLEKNPSKYADAYIKARNYLQKTSVGLTPMEGLADITGMQPMKGVMDSNFGEYLTYNDEIVGNWYELTKNFDESNFKRIGAYAISKQKGGNERLLNSGLTQDNIDTLELSTEELKAYKFARETFDGEFKDVKKYALDNYNKDVGEVENYVSFMSDNNAMDELEAYDRFGIQNESDFKTKTVEQGFTKKRVNEVDYNIELNIDKIFRRHIDNVAYMLTMGKDIKQYFEIVNSPEIKEKLGDIGSVAWLQYLDLMARKGGSEGAKRIEILDMLRKNMAAGVLAFRISSAAIQVTSFADTISTIGSEWATKGASSISTSKEWRDFVMDNFPEVKKAVGDDVAFREFGEGFMANMTRKGLAPLQALDGLMRSTAVAGAYQKLAVEKGIEIDFKNPDKQLIQEATRLMRQSQGSSFFKDQPLSITTSFGLMGNKSLNKTILTFQSFMLARWDNINRQVWRLGIKDKNFKKGFVSLFWMTIFAAMLEEVIRSGVKKAISGVTELITGEEDDTTTGSFAGNTVLNIVQTIPIAGQLCSAMTYSSNPIPVVNTLDQILQGADSVWGGKSLETKIKGGLTLFGGAGSLAGIPGSTQATQILKGFVQPEKKSSSSSGGGLPKLPKISGSKNSLPKLPKIK